MTDSIRAALERLIDAVLLSEDDHPMGWARIDDAIAAARTALAQPTTTDGPAVPEGREPASVVGEPSDGDPPLGPFSEHDLRQQWNQQADEFNQWDSLDSCEQLAWAQARAIAADRARFGGRPAPALAGAVGEPPAELVEQWMREASDQPPGPDARVIAALAARWGAAQVAERQGAPVPDGEVAELVNWSEPEAVFDDEDIITFWTERGGVGGVVVSPALVARARAATPARSQAAPAPAEGEAAELVRWLRMQGEAQKPGPNSLLSDQAKNERHAAGMKLTRAADLLERQSVAEESSVTAPVPVLVSERLPGPEDCLDEGWGWFFSPQVGWRQAVLPVSSAYTHWLPARALPLPSGEVE